MGSWKLQLISLVQVLLSACAVDVLSFASVTFARELVYVTNSGDGTLSVIDPEERSVRATVQVGPPRASSSTDVAVSPTGETIYYVATSGLGTLSVIDAASLRVTSTIDAGPRPHRLAISPDGRTLYVANLSFEGPGGQTVFFVDTVTHATVARFGFIAEPRGLALAPDGRRLYVAVDDEVVVIDTVGKSRVASIRVGQTPWDVTVSPDGKRAYVTHAVAESIAVLDIATSTLLGTFASRAALRIAIRPDGLIAYATSFDEVAVIETATNTVASRILAGGFPLGVVFSRSGSFAYVTDAAGNAVYVIDTATNLVVGEPIAVGVGPGGIAVGVLPERSPAPTATATSTERRTPTATFPGEVPLTPTSVPSSTLADSGGGCSIVQGESGEMAPLMALVHVFTWMLIRKSRRRANRGERR